MAKKTAKEAVKDLFDKVQSIRLNDAAAIFGTTSKVSMLQSLRAHVAELGTAISSHKSYEEVMRAYELVAGDIDTAGITGLISEDELTDYYALIDKLWACIEKEFNNKKGDA